ncbi:MAG TPA: MFS transporter [Anaerolineales bacterium]|nr:MFS transporter [Anaerolineales bacterium]
MRTFFILWVGQLISMLGSGLTAFALGVWIFDQTGKATPFALTVLFASFPRLLLSPLAGSLADRWNRRLVMLLSDTGNALVTLGAFLLLLGGNLQIWMIYLIAVIGSCFSAFQEPAYTASITMLVPKSELTRASGMSNLSQALESLLTPLAAGFLFVAIGLRGVILIDFITYFFAIGALLAVRIPQPKLAEAETQINPKGKVWQDALYGWRYLRARRGLFGLLWFYALVNFFLNFSTVLLGPLVLSRYTAREYGLVQMAVGLGLLSGSLLLSAWGGPKGRKVPAVIGFIALAGVGLALTGVSHLVVLIGFGMFVMLFSVPLASGPSQAIFQSKVAPQVQGRVFAIRSMISRSIMPLAFFLAGPLADRLLEPLMAVDGSLGAGLAGSLLGSGPGRGIGLGFVLSGLCLLAACGLAYANPSLRLLEDELPDVI